MAELQNEPRSAQWTLDHINENERNCKVAEQQAAIINELWQTNARLRHERHDAVQMCAKMDKKHENMRQQASHYKRLYEYYEKRYRYYKSVFHDSKDNTRAWQYNADAVTPPTPGNSRRWSKTQTENHAGITVQSHDDTDGTSMLFDHCDSATKASSSEPSLPSRKPALEQDAIPPFIMTPNARGADMDSVLPSSETTEADGNTAAEGDQAIKQEASTQVDSLPQVVHERPAPGRPRHRTKAAGSITTTITAADGTCEKPFMIKEESDGPGELIASRSSPHAETFDLDEVTENIETPRKRRRIERMRTLQRVNGFSQRIASNLSYDRATSAPVGPRYSNEQQQQDQGERDALRISFDGKDASLAPPKPHLEPHLQALRPLDPNQQVTPRQRDQKPMKKPRSNRDADILYFTEDGENFSKPNNPTPKTPHTAQSTRLQSLLKHPTTKQSQYLSTPDTTTRTNPNPPLRTLAPDQLHRTDFKINPQQNSSRQDAYHETLRRKSEKACRPGCLDPDCCGGYWRRLAELEFAPSSSSSRADESEENKWDNHQKLVNHLGGGPYAQRRARAMSPRSRRELLLDARASELAQTHGKHRQRFQRRRTPPGFWRAEFPDTQERAEERAEGERMEREVVEGRWREAMRGGLWVFRDEA